jgi:hypothetical protein
MLVFLCLKFGKACPHYIERISNALRAMSPRAPVHKPRAKIVGANPAPATSQLKKSTASVIFVLSAGGLTNFYSNEIQFANHQWCMSSV